MNKLFFLIVFILGIYSCSEDSNDINQKLSAQTNKFNYINGETISFNINNFNSTTAHLASCCTSVAFYIDKNKNESWTEQSNYGLPCLALCPGIDLRINYLGTLSDSIVINESGKFRIRIPYTFNSDQKWTNEVVSNSFTIE